MKTMRIPYRLPGLKWITLLWSLYAIVWVALEGSLWWTVSLAVFTATVSLGYLVGKTLGGRTVSLGLWLLALAGLGALLGLASALFTLFFMAIKTGIHAHGPEFTAMEVNWVLQQIPLWIVAGLIGGLGFWFVVAGRCHRHLI